MINNRYATLAKIRQQRRDHIRRLLKVLADEGQRITVQIEELRHEQQAITADLAARTAHGRLDVDALLRIKQHGATLFSEIAQREAAHGEWRTRFARGQQLLITAESQVRSLERLQEIEALKETRRVQRAADREATDRYAARQFQSALNAEPGEEEF